MSTYYLDYCKKFIVDNIDGYCSIITQTNLPRYTDTEDLLCETFADKYKISLLSTINNPITACNPKYSDQLKAQILNTHYQPTDLPSFAQGYIGEGAETKRIILVKVKEWLRLPDRMLLQLPDLLLNDVLDSSPSLIESE